MIYLSIDYEREGSEECKAWEVLQGAENACIQYPYEIGAGDVSLVDATMGGEWVPRRIEDGGKPGGIAVAVVTVDYHVQRKRREASKAKNAADLNPAIHHIETCCVNVDRVAVDANMENAREEYGEILKAVGAEMAENPNMVAPIIELVSDWAAYVMELVEVAEMEGK